MFILFRWVWQCHRKGAFSMTADVNHNEHFCRSQPGGTEENWIQKMKQSEERRLMRARAAWACRSANEPSTSVCFIRCRPRSEGASWGLFSHSCSETELSRGSRESWPSVGEIWIVERSFHGFLFPHVLKFPHLPFQVSHHLLCLPSKCSKCFTGGLSLFFSLLSRHTQTQHC